MKPFHTGDRVETLQGRRGTVLEKRKQGALVSWDIPGRRSTIVWYCNLRHLGGGDRETQGAGSGA